jgi:hypothetical protein
MGPCGERGWRMLPRPHPCLPTRGEYFPVYIPMGETSLSTSPNRGILHMEIEDRVPIAISNAK